MSGIYLVSGAILVVLVVLTLFRKLSTIVKMVIAVVCAVIICVGYVLLFPAKPVSIWLTSNITSAISLDKDNKYETGEVLYSFSSENDDSADVSSESLNGFVKHRVGAIIEKYVELKEQYTLSFKDAYLIITPNVDDVTVEIIKGEYLEEI